ncbi:hypothetical protein M422DRAFT_255394, partial [Sphaerobolus stellatus SS14]
TCAVNTGVYILGRPIVSLFLPEPESNTPAKIELQDVPDVLSADIVVMEGSYLSCTNNNIMEEKVTGVAENSSTLAAHAVVISNTPVVFPPAETKKPQGGETEAEAAKPEVTRTAAIVFPPSSMHPYAVQMMVMGEETLSCPRGKYILYASTLLPSTSTSASAKAESTLKPYIATLIPQSSVDFTCYYTRSEPSIQAEPETRPNARTFMTSQLHSSWPEIGDEAATEAGKMFADVMKGVVALKKVRGEEGADELWQEGDPMWPVLERDEDDQEW